MIRLILLACAAIFLYGCARGPHVTVIDLRSSPATRPDAQARTGETDAVRVFSHEDGFPPMDLIGHKGGGGARRGIYPDIMDEICRRVGISWTPVLLPPGRIYSGFRNGEFDIEIGTSPAWRSLEQDISLYTQSFADDTTSLILRSGDSVDSVFARTKRPVIATVIGYIYPDYQSTFDKGRAARLDAPNEQAELEMLKSGRVDAALITTVVARYLAAENHVPLSFGPVVGRTSIMIRINVRRKELLDKFNAALSAMKKDGTLSAIYAKYE